MNKELTVTLLKKDIAELAQLTEGFEELDFFPNPLLDLAQSKAEKIVENLVTLRIDKENVKAATKINEEKTTAIAETKPEMEKDVEPEEEPVAAILPKETITNKKECVDKPVEEISAKKITIQEETNEEQAVENEQPAEPTEGEVPIEPAVATTADKPVETAKILADTIAPQTVTRNESLQNQKVDDIKQAISLGDRFLFQRELFGGNGELMTRTINNLNNCQTLEDAQQLIAKKFNWDMENSAAAHFMQIISRRF